MEGYCGTALLIYACGFVSNGRGSFWGPGLYLYRNRLLHIPTEDIYIRYRRD